jgi:hypothetical protein
MRQELTIADIERCFGGGWFSLNEAWTNLFSTYSVEEFGSRNRKDGMRRVLENLHADGFLDKAGELGPFTREYRLTEKAGNFRKSIPVKVVEQKLPGTLAERLEEYEKALEKSVRQEGYDAAIIDDPRRQSEWVQYRRLNKAMQRVARRR